MKLKQPKKYLFNKLEGKQRMQNISLVVNERLQLEKKESWYSADVFVFLIIWPFFVFIIKCCHLKYIMNNMLNISIQSSTQDFFTFIDRAATLQYFGGPLPFSVLLWSSQSRYFSRERFGSFVPILQIAFYIEYFEYASNWSTT